MDGKMECITNKISHRWTMIVLLTLIFISVYLVTSPFDRGLCPESLADKIGLFSPIITDEEKRSLRSTLLAFKDAVHLNITYFMDAGTLLGSYRHHGFIPWDLDIDFMVKTKDRNVLQECLEARKAEYELAKVGEVWRFYRKDSSGSAWLHMDIFFFEENTSQVWGTHADNIHLKYDKNDIFPLIERPFMGMMLPAPRNTPLVLSKKYDVNMCKTNNYKRHCTAEISCHLLKGIIPFENRDHAYNKTHLYETLEISNNIGDPVKCTKYIIPK